MEKTGLYVAGAFLGGILIGGTVGYLLAKKNYDEQQQSELDEVANYYKKKYANKEEKDETKKDEENVVKVDKPSITEMSSIVAGYNSDTSMRTTYNITVAKDQVKEKLKTLQKEKSGAKVTALDYSGYMELDETGTEMEFKYNTDTETWLDWNNVEYDVDELPFDSKDIPWFDGGQCYLVDNENHCTYILEKISSLDDME